MPMPMPMHQSLYPSLIPSLCRLLGSDLRVLLNSDLVVGLEGGDEVVGELGTRTGVSMFATVGSKLRDVRETLDQLELVGDLAALGLDILLCLLKVLGGRLGLESDLDIISIPTPVWPSNHVSRTLY